MLVDQDGVAGVITDDSDAFLYGASVVLRNFTLDGTRPMIDCYHMNRIQEQLGLGYYIMMCALQYNTIYNVYDMMHC